MSCFSLRSIASCIRASYSCGEFTLLNACTLSAGVKPVQKLSLSSRKTPLFPRGGRRSRYQLLRRRFRGYYTVSSCLSLYFHNFHYQGRNWLAIAAQVIDATVAKVIFTSVTGMVPPGSLAGKIDKQCSKGGTYFPCWYSMLWASPGGVVLMMAYNVVRECRPALGV
ncbi:hypothetical protein AAFN90_03895 [Erwiniaceae bacterium CAU 1747]